jgi:hypothetical protein
MRTSDYFEREALNAGGTVTRGGTWCCWHRWTLDEVEGAYRYRACGRCGRRKVTTIRRGLVGGPDWGWLRTGTRSPPPSPPPAPRDPTLVSR